MSPRFDDDTDFRDSPYFRLLPEFVPLPRAERNLREIPNRPVVTAPRLNSLFVLPLAEDSMIESPARQDVGTEIRPMAPLPRPLRPPIPKGFLDWPRSQDRRRSSPVGSGAWPSNVYGAAAQVVGGTPRRWRRDALICVDRQVRREVLFAKRKGGAGHRRPRRTWMSDIYC